MRKGILLLSLLFVALMGQAQLVLNEVSQGPTSSSKEYFEFVVVGTRTCTDSTADLRGWIVDDNNGWIQTGAGTGIAAGAIRFANINNWSKVPYGSIIVIYNEDDKNTRITMADDPTDANHDYVYVLPANSSQLERHFSAPASPSSSSFTYPTTGWGQGTAADWHWGTVALANSGDAIVTVKPTALNSAHFSFAYAIGSAATATVFVTDMPGGKNYYNSTANYTQAASWIQGDAGVNETPGAANGGANTTWIDAMRVQVAGGNAGTITGGPSLCTGDVATFTSSGTPGGVWSSANPLIATVGAATGVVTGVSAGTTSITYTVGSGSCAVSVSAPVTVVQKPAVAPITGPNTVCVNSQVVLSSLTPGGTWSTSDASIAAFVSSGSGTATVQGAAAGTATLTYLVVNGSCATQQTFTLTVNPLPAVSPIIGGSVCPGASVTLSSTPAGGTWSSANPAVATITPGGVVTGITPGTTLISYSVTQNGCTASTTTSVTVNTAIPVQPTTGASTLCLPGQTVLTNPAINGSGIWTATPAGIVTLQPSLAAGGPSTVTVTAVSAGVVTINFTALANVCSSTVPFVMTVNASPAVAPITGANTVCLGATTTFSSATPGGTWSSANPALAPISSTGVITGSSVGTVTIDYTVTSGGCTGLAQKTISVSPLPVVGPITGTPSVCVGQTTTLSNASAGVSTWSSSNPAVATVSGAGVVTGLSAGTAIISFTVVNAEGCTAAATINVTVATAPVLGPIVGGGNLCTGTSTNLAHPTAGGTWSSLQPAIATVSPTGVVTAVGAGTATIRYTVSNGSCTSFVDVAINVTATPAPGPISGNTGLCLGATTTLSNALPGGTWSSNNISVASVNNNGVVTALSIGTTQIAYSVTNNGCTGVATTNVSVQDLAMQLTVTPNPVNAGTPITFTSSGNIPHTITAWGPGGFFSNQSATTQTITAAQSGDYFVVGNSGGCIDTARVTLVVNAITDDLFVPNFFTPNGDGRNDVLYIYGSAIAAVDFRIFNQWGEPVFSSADKGRGWDGTISGKAQPVGVYMYVARVTLIGGAQKTLKGSINLIR